MADGQSNKQIAWALQLSIETVKSLIKTIFEELGVDDRTHAVTVAARGSYFG